MTATNAITMGLNAAILTVVDDLPRVLVVRHADHVLAAPENSPESLPFGPFDPAHDRTLDLGLRRWISELTGLKVGYVEQLYTFGNRFRDPGELHGGPRVISVGYLGLLHEQTPAGRGEAHWHEVYDYLPWEDWRKGQPALLASTLLPQLEGWAAEAPSPTEKTRRTQRIMANFGTATGTFDPERVLERFELLYDAGLVAEAHRDYAALNGKTDNLPISRPLEQHPQLAALTQHTGHPMALDHRRILAAALQRVRGKLKYRPLVFELLPKEFTLFQLQRVVEALSGVGLHKQNFRRLVLNEQLVEETGKMETAGRGRPAALFRFREQARYERLAPGVGLPR